MVVAILHILTAGKYSLNFVSSVDLAKKYEPHTLKYELVRWASYFANQKSIDPNTGKETAIIERSQIGSEALRRENPNYSNYDIREIVMKNCISIWQKATIRMLYPMSIRKNKNRRLRKSHTRLSMDRHRLQSL